MIPQPDAINPRVRQPRAETAIEPAPTNAGNRARVLIRVPLVTPSAAPAPPKPAALAAPAPTHPPGHHDTVRSFRIDAAQPLAGSHIDNIDWLDHRMGRMAGLLGRKSVLGTAAIVATLLALIFLRGPERRTHSERSSGAQAQSLPAEPKSRKRHQSEAALNKPASLTPSNAPKAAAANEPAMTRDHVSPPRTAHPPVTSNRPAEPAPAPTNTGRFELLDHPDYRTARRDSPATATPAAARFGGTLDKLPSAANQ